MRRSALTLAALLLSYPVLAGCSSPSPASSEAGGSVSAAPASAAPPSAASPSAASPASATAPAESGSGSGKITFHGKLSGTMTMFVCHEGGPAQLNVAVDGQDTTYAGLIDADDFTFVAPGSTGYTLAKGASKPQVSGKTYTVKNTELVGITNDDTVTADGSVTCP